MSEFYITTNDGSTTGTASTMSWGNVGVAARPILELVLTPFSEAQRRRE